MRMNGIRYPFDLFGCSSICMIFMGEDRNMQRLHLFCSYHVPYRYRYSCPSCNNTRNKPSFTYPQQADQCMLTKRCAWGERSELGREYTFALLLPVRLARLVMASQNTLSLVGMTGEDIEIIEHEVQLPPSFRLSHLSWCWRTLDCHPWCLIPWFTDVVIFLSRHLSLDCLDFFFSWHLYCCTAGIHCTWKFLEFCNQSVVLAQVSTICTLLYITAKIARVYETNSLPIKQDNYFWNDILLWFHEVSSSNCFTIN